MRRLLPLVAATMLAWAPNPVSADPSALAASGSVAVAASAEAAARVVDAFHAALARGDAGSALALLAEDVIVFEEGGAERSKAEYARHHLSADPAFSGAVGAQRSRRTGRAEGVLAWIGTESRARGALNGKPVDRLSTETMVLRQQDGRWLIVHIHWSSRAASPAR